MPTGYAGNTPSLNCASVSPDGWTLMVSDAANRVILPYDLPLTPSSMPTQEINAVQPVDIKFDSNGNMFVALGTGGIFWWAPPWNGKPAGAFLEINNNIQSLAIDSTNELYANENTDTLVFFPNPTKQTTSTTVTVKNGPFSRMLVIQNTMYGLGYMGGMGSYTLPLTTGEAAAPVYFAPQGSTDIALSPANEIVIAGNNDLTVLAPPTYGTASAIVSVAPHKPSSVAFFTPH